MNSAANAATFQHVFRAGKSLDSPTLVLLHGTGGDENDLLDLGAAIDSNANLLGIRGRSREEGMNRFFRRYAEGVFDEHDIRLQATALARFLEQTKQSYSLTGPLIGVGYSNGANMLAAMLLLEPTIFQAAILMRSMLPLESPNAPNLSGTRVLMLNGENDPMAPAESAKALADVLRSAGADVSHRSIPTGHSLSRADIQLAIAWMSNEEASSRP